MDSKTDSRNVTHLPTDHCPACRAEILSPDETELEGFRTGYSGTVAVYKCKMCGHKYRVYWPGASRKMVNRAKAMLGREPRNRKE